MIKWIFIFAPLVWLPTLSCARRIPAFAGPYRVVILRVTNDSEFNSTGQFWGKLYSSHSKTKQQQYIWGKTFIGVEINNDMKVEVRMSVWANNQWKRNAFLMKSDRACTTAQNHAKSMKDFVYGADKIKCPLLPMGLQTHANRSWDFSFPSFPTMPYGRYLFDLCIKQHGGTVVGVIVAIVDLIPKV